MSVNVVHSRSRCVLTCIKDGKRPFDLAMRNGHLSTAGRLVLAGERVEDLTVETHPLVFHWACKNKRVDVARNIVEHHGTEWKDKYGYGRDALDIVAVYDNVEIADIILKSRLSHGNDVETTTRCVVLHWAHKNSRVDVIRKIVEQGTEVKDDLGRTLLHYAADHGNCDVVDVLLSNKANADATDDYGKRPFHLSVRNGHLSTAVQLVLASEKVEDLTVETRPLVFHWACKNKRVDVARNIVEHHGTEWKDEDGRDALDIVAVYVAVETRCVVLHWAHKNSRVDVIRKIVEQGTEVKDDVRSKICQSFV
ncbi:putative ankyrin repeat protein RF_0381 [Corticium candelabrum]|uniref:putative ankyrin repeat protein RF_0381 n=1 Tax=Corticium candelabrum TaxID=121492 RepID=UPI002E255967|nr:putative ankyrin repeat protein RF_0381 [Corticium candelabrum]